MLFGAQFDAIGQWAAKLTSKSEVELAPLFAQVGECTKMFSKRFENASYPYTSSIGQEYPRQSESYASIFRVTFHTLSKFAIVSL